MLLLGGGFCCFLAFEDVDGAGGEGSEECEGADYAAGERASRSVVRGAGLVRGTWLVRGAELGRDRGKSGAGCCVWDSG